LARTEKKDAQEQAGTLSLRVYRTVKYMIKKVTLGLFSSKTKPNFLNFLKNPRMAWVQVAFVVFPKRNMRKRNDIELKEFDIERKGSTYQLAELFVQKC